MIRRFSLAIVPVALVIWPLALLAGENEPDENENESEEESDDESDG